VHCHDWQTALAPALISLAERRPVTVFTIHNLAYQGLFDAGLMEELHLPPQFWCPEGLEFYGQLSFIKGGLMYADHVTTVSPTYAREIQTPEFGCGLENALRLRSDSLTGILNGIDDTVWDPATDLYLHETYDRQQFSGKAQNKKALQKEANFRVSAKTPVLSQVARLVSQKGVDLVIGAIHRLLEKKLSFQFVSLGNGEPEFEEGLTELATNFPKRVYSMIGYDEVHAHQILAGSDMFLVPSRFEPCGLTQMYSLRYGAIPIVRNVGGLADTVVDASKVNLQAGQATGFVFEDATVDALADTIERAIHMYKDQETWPGWSGMRWRRIFPGALVWTNTCTYTGR
jgi:starch synthase